MKKASDVIRELQVLMATHGDLEVYTLRDEEGNGGPIALWGDATVEIARIEEYDENSLVHPDDLKEMYQEDVEYGDADDLTYEQWLKKNYAKIFLL